MTAHLAGCVECHRVFFTDDQEELWDDWIGLGDDVGGCPECGGRMRRLKKEHIW